MTALSLYRIITRCACFQSIYSSLAAQRAAPVRRFCSERVREVKANPESKENTSAEDIFSPENVKDLSPVEVARMRVTYGLVKEHVEALEKGLSEIDPDTNPLIDPRSFDIRKLPRLPNEVLRHFRNEVPPEVAAVSKPVYTHGLWEAIRNGEDHDLLHETPDGAVAQWNSVDEQTMDPRTLSRMRRQAVGGLQGQPESRPQHTMGFTQTHQRKRKKACPLKDERGRVMVDYRAVGTLTALLSDDLKLVPRRKSGLCAKTQRKLSKAVKTARQMALIHPEPKPKLTVEEMLEMDRNLP